MKEQTTAERITALIFDAIRMDSTTFEAVDAECTAIAAEIAALTSERNHALAEVSRLGGQLSKALAEIERLTPAADLGNAYMAYMDEDNDAPLFLDALETAMFHACRAAEARAPEEK